jgi:hypothetical protein
VTLSGAETDDGLLRDNGHTELIIIWRDFEVAHFFPLAYEGHWMEHNYDRWITIPPATESAGSINCVQNGMLLREDIHTLFDGYDVFINLDV